MYFLFSFIFMHDMYSLSSSQSCGSDWASQQH